MTRPLIGIPSRTIVDPEYGVRYGGLAAYTRALDLAGGAPVHIPLRLTREALEAIYASLDGLLLAGGVDIHPREFGEPVAPYCDEIDPARDETELDLTRRALAEGKPVLGICRGVQLLNVAAGGSLYQDIEKEWSGEIRHEHKKGEPFSRLVHTIEIDAPSRLAQALGTTGLEVNSLHHQSIKRVAPGLKVVARAPDGVVEGLEGLEGRFILGVQFHPEWLVDEDSRMLGLFRALVESALDYRAKR